MYIEISEHSRSCIFTDCLHPIRMVQHHAHSVCNLIHSEKIDCQPFSPSRSTSNTGGVAEPTTTHPAAIASRNDHDRTNG